MLQTEVEEGLDKVRCSLKIYNQFRSAFREFKSRLPEYFESVQYDVINDPKWNEFKDDDLRKESEKKKKRQMEMKPATWDFQEDLIFKRYDAFVARLSTIQEFFRTSEQFLKLVCTLYNYINH